MYGRGRHAHCYWFEVLLANLIYCSNTPWPSFLLQLRVRSLGILILNQRSRAAHIQPFRAYDTFGGEKERVSEAAHWISIRTFSILSFLRTSYHIERWRKVSRVVRISTFSGLLCRSPMTITCKCIHFWALLKPWSPPLKVGKIQITCLLFPLNCPGLIVSSSLGNGAMA